MYYLYHIPGKKIGVTRDLNNRVTKWQGYQPGEYEVLDSSEDINYISRREIELQKSYGYKVDRQLYSKLNQIKSNMKVNVTQQTTTFPVPINKLKGRLLDNIGLTWETQYGATTVTPELVKWIMDNVSTSMYNTNRCYIYNKALHEFRSNPQTPTNYFDASSSNSVSYIDRAKLYSHHDQFELIREWAKERGLYDKGDVKTQYVKLMEEAGEVARAIIKNDQKEIVDGIGDMVVVLTNLAHLANTKIETCIDAAYKEISSRKGAMVNGSFVKETQSPCPSDYALSQRFTGNRSTL